MSRTYRKNPRRFCKFRGVIINSWNGRTIKSKAKDYYKVDYRWEGNQIIYEPCNEFTDAYWAKSGVARFYEEVIVCDGDNFTYIPSDVKKLCRRIDRARSKQSLRNGGDGHIKSSYDPWDWD